MKALLITQWYPPEPGPAKVPSVIAKALRDLDINPTVLTGFPNYPAGELQPGWKIRPLHDSKLEDIRILRVPLVPAHDTTVGSRFLNYASFGISAAIAYPLLRLTKKLDRPDVMRVINVVRRAFE